MLRAFEKEEGTLLSNEVCGALRSTSCAISTILRNTSERFSGPNETAWKESGILAFIL